MSNETMKAVVFKGPKKVVIEERPIPKIQDATDVIVKVDKVPTLQTCMKKDYVDTLSQTALCGRYFISN